MAVKDISYSLRDSQDKIFLVGSDCTSTLEPGAKCNVSVAIKPDQKGKLFTETYLVTYKTDKGSDTLSIKMTGSTLSSAGVEAGNNIYVSGTDGETLTKEFSKTAFGLVSDVATLGLVYQGAKSVVVRVQAPANKVFRIVSDCSELVSGERCNIFSSFAPVSEGTTNGEINFTAVEADTTLVVSPVTLMGEGIAPNQTADIVLFEKGKDENATDKEISFASIASGELSPSKTVVLKNKGDVAYLYRLKSTISSFSIDYNNSCIGRLDKNSSCEFNVVYGPSSVDNSEGYISFNSGKSTSFIKVKGSSTPATNGGDINAVHTDKNKLLFPETEVGFESEHKQITVTNSSATNSGKITMVLKTNNTPFSYTTTCADNTPLRAGASCDIYIGFRPSNVVDYNDNITISIDGVTPNISINLKGTGKAVSLTDNSTNIPNLTISSKKYNFPDTGVSLKSPSVQFELFNNGSEDIVNFASTSTDLIRFPLDPDFTTCGSVIPAGRSCYIAYKFNASTATQYHGYIKIHAKGAVGESIDDAYELVELIGRGVLFNKYFYFGVVSPGSTRDVSYAVVNDTNSARKINTVVVETVRWKWIQPEDNTTQDKNLWFPNNSTEVQNHFVIDNTTGARFSIITDTCKGQEIFSGESCIIKVRYSPQVGDKYPLSAYISLKDADLNTIDKFHATASPVDNVSYFFPPETNEMPRRFGDSQTAVIGQSIYYYAGGDKDIESVATADDKLRRYDAARNIWNIVDISGSNPIKDAGKTQLSGSRMIAYNGKLYLIGGGSVKGLYEFDPNIIINGKAGQWNLYSGIPGYPSNFANTTIAAYNGKIYVFGGMATNATDTVAKRLYMFDISTAKWTRLADGNIVGWHNSGAMAFYGNKMFLHGGSFNDEFGVIKGYTRDSMWEYTAELRDKNGNLTNAESADKWRNLSPDVAKISNPTTDIYSEAGERPVGRIKHGIDVVGTKLLVKSPGSKSGGGNLDIPSGLINDFYLFDPASGGKNNDDNKAVAGKEDINGWRKLNIDVSRLAQNSPVTIEGVLWFFNRTVMGVGFSTELEATAKKQ